MTDESKTEEEPAAEIEELDDLDPGEAADEVVGGRKAGEKPIEFLKIDPPAH